jgi:hypothetical protein
MLRWRLTIGKDREVALNVSSPARRHCWVAGVVLINEVAGGMRRSQPRRLTCDPMVVRLLPPVETDADSRTLVQHYRRL